MIYNVINNNFELEKVAFEIENSSYISLDFEFIRTTTFFPIISTMQIEFNGKLFIADFIQNSLDLNILKNIFINENITKIFHSCRQDVELIYYYTNIIPINIFDVQKAYSIISLDESISYDNVLFKIGILNEKPSKSEKYSWDTRPLSKDMIDYAIRDVFYLKQSMDILKDTIEQLQRTEILNYNLKELESTELYIPNCNSLFKNHYSYVNNNKELKKLYSVCHAIILTAICYNTPKHKIVTKDSLKNFSKSLSYYDLKLNKQYKNMFYYFVKTKQFDNVSAWENSKKLNPLQVKIIAEFNKSLSTFEKENNISKNSIINKEKLKNIIINQSYNELKLFQAIILGITPEIYNIQN